jgi:cytochrome P450
MTRPIPTWQTDLFSHESVRDARAVDDALREATPVAQLEDGTYIVTRYADVAAGLMDWKTFSNASRPWHDPDSLRPEILLTEDPPAHTRARTVLGNALSPRALEAMRAAFETDAATLVDGLCEREGEVIDAVSEITARFVYKVLPDVLGLPEEGRDQMHAFSHAVWATMGPPNALFDEAMEGAGPLLDWCERVTSREALAPGSVGMEMYRAADEGRVTEVEAKLLVQTILSAGADTTVLTMANAIGAFARFPDQYDRVRADPKLIRNAFDESLRWDSPSRMAGRITTRDVEIEGHVIPAGSRTGLLFAAANRDPRFWDDPDAFDVGRDVRRQVGWGYGVHACVGRTLAQMEASALLGAIVARIARFEPAGEIEPWMTTIGHGPAKLPVRFTVA